MEFYVSQTSEDLSIIKLAKNKDHIRTIALVLKVWENIRTTISTDTFTVVLIRKYCVIYTFCSEFLK